MVMRKLFHLYLFLLVVAVGVCFCEALDYKPKFFGFTKLRIVNNWEGNSSNFFNFQVNKLRMGIEGQVVDKLSYLALVEGGFVAPNSFTFSPLDIYVNYKFSPAIELRFGQDWYKFGWEYTQPIPTLPFINFSDFAATVFDGMGRTGNYGYDVGVWFNGILKLKNINLGYNGGILNGSGLNTIDNNNKKDIFIRTYLEPVEFFHLGISIFQGYSRIKTEDLKDDLFAIEVMIKFKNLTNINEFYYSENQESKKQTNLYPKIIKRGYYVFLGYGISPYQIICRYERNSNLFLSNEIGNVYTFGVNYQIKGLNKIGIDYVTRDYSMKHNISNSIIIQCQILFNNL